MSRLRFIFVAFLGLCLLGCAHLDESMALSASADRAPTVHLDLVRGMLDQGQYFAALAHIEELEKKTGRRSETSLLLLKARSYYKLGQDSAAQQLYEHLLSLNLQDKQAADAWQGLGLIAAKQNLAQAVRHFNQAVALQPTQPRYRNDLGYTLLLAGRLTEARHHLRTAAELAPDAVQSQSNLVLSYLVEGQQEEAARWAEKFALSSDQWSQLVQETVLVRQMIARRAQELSQSQPKQASHANSVAQEENAREKTASPSTHDGLRPEFTGAYGTR